MGLYKVLKESSTQETVFLLAELPKLPPSPTLRARPIFTSCLD